MSKGISKPKLNSFEEFKKTLPEGVVGENYRLEAAWKAYGSPKNFQEAMWDGLVQPISENTYKLPSIGYNEETEEYEYLNKGKENDTVVKDIRVWDNDVIPFVKELKHGGYVRTFNEEKDCWTYSKNILKRELPSESNELQINSFLKGGKLENEIPSFLTYDPLTDSYTSKYYSDDDLAEDIKWYRSKNSKSFRKKYRLNDLDWEDGTPNGKFFNYIPKKQYQEQYLKKYGFTGFGGFLDKNGEIGDGMPLKPTGEYAPDGLLLYEAPNGERFTLQPLAFKSGGQMNVIPEGALHARKNNMDLAKEGEITHKGIPVVDNNGEQQAEIEREEIIFSKDTTEKIECFYKSFKEEGISESKKDELAIKCGKFLTDLILNNTDDKTGLIEEVKLNM